MFGLISSQTCPARSCKTGADRVKSQPELSLGNVGSRQKEGSRGRSVELEAVPVAVVRCGDDPGGRGARGDRRGCTPRVDRGAEAGGRSSVGEARRAGQGGGGGHPLLPAERR